MYTVCATQTSAYTSSVRSRANGSRPCLRPALSLQGKHRDKGVKDAIRETAQLGPVSSPAVMCAVQHPRGVQFERSELSVVDEVRC